MNVLFITSTFPRSVEDNEVPWLASFIRRLMPKGIHPVVYAPSFHALGSHVYHSIPVIRFRYAPDIFEILTHEEGAVMKLREKPWLYIVSIFYIVFGILGIIRLRNHKTFDVIHVHWPFPNGIFGIVAKWLFGAKLVLTFHGAEFTLLKRVPLGPSILRYILTCADTIISNSSYTKSMIQKIGSHDVHVVPFASSVPAIRNSVTSMPTHRKTFRILFVGRLIERKGVFYLVDALYRLRRRNIPAVLDIVGSGPLRNNIEEDIQRVHLKEVVVVHGDVDRKKLVLLYQRCDVFVLPAIVDRWHDTEGLGVVLLEAMSFGKPVVASRVGGIPSIIKDGFNGFLVDEKDPDAIAQVLQKLYMAPRLMYMLGRNGMAYVKNHYNWNTVIQTTLNLYQKST